MHEARREIGKWLNEENVSEINKKTLAEFCFDYDKIIESLEVYRVAPESRNPEAETNKIIEKILS